MKECITHHICDCKQAEMDRLRKVPVKWNESIYSQGYDAGQKDGQKERDRLLIVIADSNILAEQISEKLTVAVEALEFYARFPDRATEARICEQALAKIRTIQPDAKDCE